MDLVKNGSIVTLTFLVFCELIEAMGLCKFENMFPNQEKGTIFEDRQVDLKSFTTDPYTNVSLVPTSVSSSLPTSTASWSTKKDTTTNVMEHTTIILPRTDAACPEWTEEFGSLYCVISETENWEQAAQICQNYSSRTHLVYIESGEENAFLTDLFTQKRQGNLNDAWIGLNDREEEGNWKWGEEKTLVYSNWSDDYNEPNGNEMSDQDCALLSTYFNGEWVDDRCVTKKVYYICEHEIL